MNNVFIVLSTIHIGGAEKRFTGLWKSFQENADKGFIVKLVMNEGLYQKLAESGEVNPGNKNIITANLSGKSFWQYRKNVKNILKAQATKGDIIHFIGLSPVIKIKGTRQLFSITGTRLNVDGRINMALILASALYANAIDVLDPRVYATVKKIFFWKQKKIFRTSNSFCDVSVYKPLPPEQKKDWIVFLGRFDEVKQVEQILLALPYVYKKLMQAGNKDYHFYILGHGALETKLKQILSSSEYQHLPITIRFQKDPWVIVNKSKVFLSLQLHNNYPSRSLLEAMAAGNIPVVTDVGQTRWIARPEFSYYLPEKFSKEELANTLVKVFKLDAQQFEQKTNLARNLVLAEHDVSKMQAYFESIYRQV